MARVASLEEANAIRNLTAAQPMTTKRAEAALREHLGVPVPNPTRRDRRKIIKLAEDVEFKDRLKKQ